MPQTKERLWIATADIKDMYVDAGGCEMVPFLEVLDGLLRRGVEFPRLARHLPMACVT